MKVIGALGGGGSTFLLRALEKRNYGPLFGRYDSYRLKRSLERRPWLLQVYHRLLGLLGSYRPEMFVLKRPDSFWTDWRFHESGTYDPTSPTFAQDIEGQRLYLLATRRVRSADLRIRQSDLSGDSLAALVQSYLTRIEELEVETGVTIVLLAGHWAEYGILMDLGVETIYLIRDPFNSLISHSKGLRHEKDYRRRGLANINTREWIDAYLEGPHHYWLRFAEAALAHNNSIRIRYDTFAEDWQAVEGLPDISHGFAYKENDVKGILTWDSIAYIHGKTGELCEKLGLTAVCAKYLEE